jgi:hypothetical protein
MGVLYDLRGFLSAVQGRKHFALFFEWFYPNHAEVILRALEAWADDRLAIAVLKFYLEFVNNKAQRLNFEVSSPNGILIFREARYEKSRHEKSRHILYFIFNTQFLISSLCSAW